MRLIPLILAFAAASSAVPSIAAKKDKAPGVDQGAIYSTRPSQDVVACLAQNVGGTVSGDDPVVVSVARPIDTVMYSVLSVPRKKSIYQSEVDIRSDYAHRDQFLRALSCAIDPRVVAAQAE